MYNVVYFKLITTNLVQWWGDLDLHSNWVSSAYWRCVRRAHSHVLRPPARCTLAAQCAQSSHVLHTSLELGSSFYFLLVYAIVDVTEGFNALRGVLIILLSPKMTSLLYYINSYLSLFSLTAWKTKDLIWANGPLIGDNWFANHAKPVTWFTEAVKC